MVLQEDMDQLSFSKLSEQEQSSFDDDAEDELVF